MRERNDECLCTVPLFCLSLLSLQLVVCLCSVVHRTVYTLTRTCLSARTIHDLVAWLKILRLRRPHKIRASSCHPCLQLPMSVPHSHLLPRSFHQEQSLRSHCRSTNTALLRQKRSLALWPKTPLPQVMNPTSSTTSTSHRLLKSSSRSNPATRCPRTCMTRLSDETIGKALSSPLFIQEWEEPAGRRQIYHSFEESSLSSQSFLVCHVRTVRPVHELSSLGSSSSREIEIETREELQKSHVLKVKEISNWLQSLRK